MASLTRRAFGGGISGAAALSCAGVGQARAQTGGAATFIDPELKPWLDEFRRHPAPALTQASLSEFRQTARSWAPKPLDSPPFVERMAPPVHGDKPVRIYVIGGPASADKRPAVLHLHGGGFVAGAAVDTVADLQRLSSELGCLVVSVDYRLAPETPFPGSLEDNYAALKWLHDNADALGVDRRRIAVMGQSAGGGHAAALAIAARDRAEAPICFQVLIYPMLDDRTGTAGRPTPDDAPYIWTAQQNQFGWRALLGVPPGSPSVPAGAVPARVADLSRLPPAFIGVGTADLFVDEDISFARRLIDAGVPAELMVAPGAYHGFDGIVPSAKISRQFTSMWKDALVRAFGVTAPGEGT